MWVRVDRWYLREGGREGGGSIRKSRGRNESEEAR
jgi:hypothetical protein